MAANIHPTPAAAFAERAALAPADRVAAIVVRLTAFSGDRIVGYAVVEVGRYDDDVVDLAWRYGVNLNATALANLDA